MSALEWKSSLGYAQETSHATGQPILISFHNSDCIACRQMDLDTYQNESVVRFIEEYLVPLRINTEDESFYDRYHAGWTPTLLVLDYQGNDSQRTIGYLTPEDFLAHMHLGIAKARVARREFDTALVHIKQLLELFPKSDIVPEAIFFRGHFLFERNRDPVDLKKIWEILSADYPESGWTRRAVPYREL